MAKRLIAYYSSKGQNYVNGSIRNVMRVAECLLGDFDMHKDE